MEKCGLCERLIGEHETPHVYNDKVCCASCWKEIDRIAKSTQSKQREAETVWYGKMFCNACHYSWQARRNTPPARCPSCGKRDVGPVYQEKRRGCLTALFFPLAVGLAAYFAAR